MKALSADIGGSHAACALVEDRKILALEHVTVPDAGSFSLVLPEIAAALGRMLDRGGILASACAGMAMSFPGIVDPDSGHIFSTPKGKFDDSSRLDLAAWCRKCFGLRLRIENDARMALLGEQYAGAARGSGEIAMLTLGTGVGGAAMIGGRLLRGRHFQAALGGHMPAAFEGKECICGNIGCVEAEASTWSLPRICRDWPGFAASSLAAAPSLDFATLFHSCRVGDRVAQEIRDRCLRVWAACAVGMIHAYDPEMLVVGGAVMRSGDQILPFLQSHVDAHAWTPWGKVQLRAAELGGAAGLLGAVPLLSEAL